MEGRNTLTPYMLTNEIIKMESEYADGCVAETSDSLDQQETRRYSHLIHKYEKSSLSNVPYHADVSCINRYFSEEFPFHLAIHQVKSATPDLRNYTELHTHECDEINMLIGDPGELTYIIQLGDESYQLDSCSCIWIPAGLPHSANVLEGAGYYVALRLHGGQGADSNAAEFHKLHKRMSPGI